ncbi:phage tail sheath subtilisin-like domain-containing protein [Metaclostridioides mangenotii]|uniref:phage tail sheath subtilisin-like domain-containing protein n=1 Tax=Metaclostridioides mangenotii TaxID=1540 RepID=UPI000488743A|nr:phage tail sheath subtilisin-like domain-containing protein [Clostridioides mangenotii]
MAGIVDISIDFKEQARTLVDRSKKGVVAIILKDTKKLLQEITDTKEIPKELNEKNKKYVSDAFIGYLNDNEVIKPKKVIISTYTTALVKEGETGTGIETNLSELEAMEFDYICIPEATTEQTTLLTSWVKDMREEGETAKAIVANTKADSEGIINYTHNITVEGTQIPAENYVSRIAGLLASTPATHSTTYAILPEVDSIDKLDKEITNSKIEAGELILSRIAGKIRIARGVTSLTTLTEEKGEIFQKIKLVEAIDLIENDIKKLYIEKYISKYPNTYDNKCLFIVSVQEYLSELVKLGLIESNFTVGIDLDAQKNYLISKNIDISNMKDEEILSANTGSQGFYYINLKLVDAMEDIKIKVVL